jgi:hypothetical protein
MHFSPPFPSPPRVQSARKLAGMYRMCPFYRGRVLSLRPEQKTLAQRKCARSGSSNRHETSTGTVLVPPRVWREGESMEGESYDVLRFEGQESP